MKNHDLEVVEVVTVERSLLLCLTSLTLMEVIPLCNLNFCAFLNKTNKQARAARESVQSAEKKKLQKVKVKEIPVDAIKEETAFSIPEDFVNNIFWILASASKSFSSKVSIAS